MFNRAPSHRRGFRFGPRLIIAGIIAAIALMGYFGNSALNPVTGKKQHISISPDQEIALGLQAAPEMARQFGGLHGDPAARELVARVGSRIVGALPGEAHDYPYEFHLLADDQTVNAFALPGGQVFITHALLTRLTSEGQLAGVLAHEVGHVIGRHSAAQLAKAELTQGLIGATGVAASDGSGGGQSAAAIASMVGNVVNLRFGREDELESDRLGVRFMAGAGYDPRSLIGVMKVLQEASGGGGRAPDFMATHPNPDRRMERIQEAIQQEFPNGVPEGLVE